MKAIIIHGWGGGPYTNWLPWLKSELENRNWQVLVPAMPDTEHPKINPWLDAVAKAAADMNLDENTVLIGGSIGCQAILRYLENLADNIKISGAVLVAPWMQLDEQTIKEEGEESIEIAKPWVETPIDFARVKKHSDKFIAIFSDNDPFVPISQKEVFADKLGAKTIVETGEGHFDGKQYQVILDNVLQFSKN